MDWKIPAVFAVAEYENGACVVGASVMDTMIKACEKALLEVSQSIVGYTGIFTGEIENKVKSAEQVTSFQDHSYLYLNEKMSRYLEFLDSGQEIIVENDHISRSDSEIRSYFINELIRIKKSAYFINTTPQVIKQVKGWNVGRVMIKGLLDIEPGFIKKLLHPG